ncbi:hypothetical protein DM02DRAFT_671432 [Periconia macrospinosa]|uniref:Uncharacterized protein n=1 Tax=Periconia macrospinosa TaxID=97972 RepID=A0A2V1DSC9_9PLEO|nr:hypothetical protein DM02DRAFT_671432 [Periconia macrospinosa]
MQFSAIASSLILGLLVQSTTAAVSYGKSSAGEPIAWIEGESECRSTRIAGPGLRVTLPAAASPAEGVFGIFYCVDTAGNLITHHHDNLTLSALLM